MYVCMSARAYVHAFYSNYLSLHGKYPICACMYTLVSYGQTIHQTIGVTGLG